MSRYKLLGMTISMLFALVITASAQDAKDVQSKVTTLKPQVFLESLVGSWEGTCRTWFRPGELADES